MNLLPVNLTFTGGIIRSLQAVRRDETRRRFTSYIFAAMLALPLGALPSLLRYYLGLNIHTAQLANPAPALPTFNILNGGLPVLLGFVMALAFIVWMSVLSDRVFEKQNRLAREALQNTDLSIRVLDSNLDHAIDELQSFVVLPEIVGVRAGESLPQRVDHFAYYYRHYLSSEETESKRPFLMAWRQTLILNFLLCICVSVLCFVIVGFVCIPFLAIRLFHTWPAVQARRMALAQFLYDACSEA